MNNVLALWSEDFRKLYPSVRIEIEGKGSGTAPPALIQGTADFGPMSRDMNPAETAQFAAKFGYPPTQLRVAIDMLAIFVHRDNPLDSLTLQQLDALFSVGRKRGYGKEIRTWGDLGLTGEWANKPISLYGRNPASGTHDYFREHVLEKGDFKPTVKQLGGSSAVIQGVANDRYGIGYSGIGYKTADVKVISLARDKKSPAVPAGAQSAYDGTYPLSRFLLLSINYMPKSKLTPSTAEFIKYVFSRHGQADVIKEGFLPVPGKLAERGLNSVGLCRCSSGLPTGQRKLGCRGGSPPSAARALGLPTTMPAGDGAPPSPVFVASFMNQKPITGHSRRRETRWGVHVTDRVAQGLIAAGGIGTIVAVLLVCVFLVWVVVPLFWPAKVQQQTTAVVDWSSEAPRHIVLDEDQRLGYAPAGRRFTDRLSARQRGAARPPRILAGDSAHGGRLRPARGAGRLRLRGRHGPPGQSPIPDDLCRTGRAPRDLA